MVEVIRDKVFTIKGTPYFDARDYELNYARKHNKDLKLVLSSTDEVMIVPFKEINKENFILIGKNHSKEYPANFKQDEYGIKAGDTYKLYSIKWNPK